MQFLFLLSLPFCSALSGSHVTFTLGDSTYSHGDKMEFNHSTPVFAAASATSVASSSAYVPSTAPVAAPVYYTPPPPVFYAPTPAPYSPTTAPYHLAPIRYLHDPVVVSHPPYHHYSHVYAPAPVYQAPIHNCSVVTEMTMAEVCTPSLQTTCIMEELAVKTVTENEQCMNVMRTVCSEAEEEIKNEACVYTYQDKSEDTMATNYKVIFEKECKTQKVSVCQPSAGYGHQYCKEVEQETCSNIPMVMPMNETVTVSYPEPVMECMQKPITIPSITCEDMTEERCIMVPVVTDDTIMVEKCEVSLGSPSCQMMEVTLPKQVCKELVYGQTFHAEQQSNPQQQNNTEQQNNPHQQNNAEQQNNP